MMGELTCSPLIGERRTDAAAREKNIAYIVEAPPLVHVVVRDKEILEMPSALN